MVNMVAVLFPQALIRILLFPFAVDCLAVPKQQRGSAYSSCSSVRKLFSPGASGEQNFDRNVTSRCIAVNTVSLLLS